MSDKMSDQLGKLVVHVRGDSDSDLDALFNVLKNVDPSQQQNSFKHRNLPASFFKPPEPRQGLNHSREGSQDSTSTGYSVASHRPAAHGPAGLAISHGRSLSSPAQLPHTLSAVPPAPIHIKQQSLAGEFTDELGHLPHSWELNKAAGSGADQRYFLNHVDHRNTWQDPRKSMSTSALNQSQPLSPQTHQSSSLTNLSPLPHGWEQAVTPEGEIYYINHVDKCTSWYDPRRLIPCCTAKHLQGPGPVKIGSGPDGPLSQQQPPPPGPLQTRPQLSPNQQSAQGAPPPQRVSDQFIRGELQRLQQEKARLQREQDDIARREVMLKRATQPVAPNPVFTPGLTPAMQASSQPQQRLFEGTSSASRPFQEMLRSPPNVSCASTSQPEMVTSMQTAMQSVSTSGVDPFLGQGGNSLESHARQNSGDSGLGGMGNSYSLESHARQNSGDSGLGGMGNSYSLPRTPEDFLSNVDEMDSQESHKMSKPASADFVTAVAMQGVISMEVAQVADPGDMATSMDCGTDDLVSTLQGDISSELLSDMEMQKIDSLLTWL